jgi:hypothetical protein
MSRDEKVMDFLLKNPATSTEMPAAGEFLEVAHLYPILISKKSIFLK